MRVKLLAVGLLFAGCATEAPEQIALNYLRAHYAGHHREAYTYLSLQDRQAMSIGDYVSRQESLTERERDRLAAAKIRGIRSSFVGAETAVVRIDVDLPDVEALVEDLDWLSPQSTQRVELVWAWHDDWVGEWGVDAGLQQLSVVESPDHITTVPLQPGDPWWADNDRPLQDIDPNEALPNVYQAGPVLSDLELDDPAFAEPPQNAWFEMADEIEALFPPEEMSVHLPEDEDDDDFFGSGVRSLKH